MKSHVLEKLCNKILDKNKILGAFPPCLLDKMVHRDRSDIPKNAVTFKLNDLLICFLQFEVVPFCHDELYYVSIIQDDIETDWYIANDFEERHLIGKLFARHENQVEELLKDFLES